MAKRSTKQMTISPRMIFWIGLLIVLVLVGFMGWNWTRNVQLEEVYFEGMQQASEAEMLTHARVDTVTFLYDVDPLIVADRVQRHPWVRQADVTRWPTGVLAIKVEERVPVALVLNRQGEAAYYLDASGYQMPVDSGVVFDIPLLRGVPASYRPVNPVVHPTLQELLPALAELNPETNRLIAEMSLSIKDDIEVYTIPTEEREPIRVWFGRNQFAEKFERLQAFWEQAILTQPEKKYALIDLRFDNQIVVK
jgi:cell division protein FtsQ